MGSLTADKKPASITLPGKNCAAQCPGCRAILDPQWSANECGYVPNSCECGVRIKWKAA